MKLKYYLRGLGIGIVVTALLMGFATKGNQEMSDEEIKARAAELGMVEQLTLADMRDNADSSQAGKATEAPTEAPAVTEVPSAATEVPVTEAPAETTDMPVESTEVPEATEIPAEEPTEAPDATEDPQNTNTPSDTAGVTEEPQTQPPTAEILGDVVQVTIYEGNHSGNVSRVLAEAGLVESATAFDKYLRQNGFSKIINTGTYKITLGTSEEDIAHIITNTD